MKIWNKLMTLSKAFKKRHGWRITYMTLNPPLLKCRIFVFGAMPGGKVTDRGPIVWKATNNGLHGVLGKKIARLQSTYQSLWSSWCVGEEDSKVASLWCWGRRQRAASSWCCCVGEEEEDRRQGFQLSNRQVIN